MIALLRKDAPWLLFCLVGGLVGLTIALVQDGPLQVFVLRAPRLQGGFHTSWIAGMLLGGIAGGFDELLGTREFLQQRPIAASRLALSRLLGCGLVLMTWMLVVPVLAWTWAQLFDDHVPLGEFGGWPQWLATNSVAWSACGIGLCAASLPLRGPVRLLLAFLLFWSAFLIVHLATRDVDMSELAYGLGHALVALATGGVAWVALQMGRDADRPPVAAMRAVVVPMLVTAAIVGANCCIVAWQAQAVSRLQVEYPQPKQVGREVVLVSHPYSTGRRVVGPDHQPIERALGTMQDFGYGHDWRWLSRDTEFEEPNWGSLQSVRFAHGRLWQGVDGRHWMEQHGQRARLVTRDGAAASVAPTIIKELGPLSAETAVLLEPGATAVWRFVPERSQFVEVPTPDGGRVREFGALRNDQLKGLALPAGVPIGHDSSWFRFVRGDSANYALVGEALQVLPTGAESAAPTAMAPRDEHAGDPLEYTITVPTSEDRDAFVHTFAPRTTRERYYAGQVVAWSLLRPPVAQVGGHGFASAARPGWLLDAIVVDGRRSWLVLTNAALWLLVAFGVARRLRGIGAPRGVARGWAIATALLGPVAALASIVLERPRAFADRRAVAPPAPPLIATVFAH